jgi:glycerol-1-phosphate dehydrogenase [NAD(P)+]
MSELVDAYLAQYHDVLETRACLIERGAIENCWELLAEHLDSGLWLVVSDANTWRAAGARTAAMLDAAGQPWERYDVETPAEGDAICSEALIADFERAFAESGAAGAIALGSGTINDVVKMGCHRAERPMAVIGTAPSMNGYNSSIAAILADGVKTTQVCTAPRVVVADLDVMAAAPSRMIASGLGDLISKPVSNSDWRLSARLLGTHHSPAAMEIIEHGARALDGVAENLPGRDLGAIRGLVESLILSGIAMSVAGSSSPASGGEHLISHYIDMTAYAFDKPHDLHGCQVGVGTLTTALFYENLQALDPAAIDVEARVDALPAWEEYEEALSDRFGRLFDAVVKHARRGYPTRDSLRARLNQLVAEWDTILGEVRQTLRSQKSLEDELKAAGGPLRFAELGVDRDRARRAITHSKDIRNRYTILHLGWELGLLDEWADTALERLYE